MRGAQRLGAPRARGPPVRHQKWKVKERVRHGNSSAGFFRFTGARFTARAEPPPLTTNSFSFSSGTPFAEPRGGRPVSRRGSRPRGACCGKLPLGLRHSPSSRPRTVVADAAQPRRAPTTATPPAAATPATAATPPAAAPRRPPRPRAWATSRRSDAELAVAEAEGRLVGAACCRRSATCGGARLRPHRVPRRAVGRRRARPAKGQERRLGEGRALLRVRVGHGLFCPPSKLAATSRPRARRRSRRRARASRCRRHACRAAPVPRAGTRSRRRCRQHPAPLDPRPRSRCRELGALSPPTSSAGRGRHRARASTSTPPPSACRRSRSHAPRPSPTRSSGSGASTADAGMNGDGGATSASGAAARRMTAAARRCRRCDAVGIAAALARSRRLAARRPSRCRRGARHIAGDWRHAWLKGTTSSR